MGRIVVALLAIILGAATGVGVMRTIDRSSERSPVAEREAPSTVEMPGRGNPIIARRPESQPEGRAQAGANQPSQRELVLQQEGKAAFYSDAYQGRTTASGAPLDQSQLTAASHAFPLGAHATVTHLENGKSVAVTINDRGPNVQGRIIDLSKSAAAQLGIVQEGVAPVRVDVRPSEQPTPQLREEVLKKAQTTSSR